MNDFSIFKSKQHHEYVRLSKQRELDLKNQRAYENSHPKNRFRILKYEWKPNNKIGMLSVKNFVQMRFYAPY